MIQEHDCVVLTQDLADEGLRAGDVGTVVHIHSHEAAYEVEFMTLTGQTVAVATVLPSQLRPPSSATSRTFASSRPRKIAITGFCQSYQFQSCGRVAKCWPAYAQR